MARVIPVLDVMGGHVVRAVGGRRDDYRPVRSRLTDSTDPRAVAECLLRTTGARELYLADIDALRGYPATDLNADALRCVLALDVPVWVDAGLRAAFDEGPLLAVGADRFVIGTETADGAFAVTQLAATHGGDRVAVSVDLRGGQMIGLGTTWGPTPEESIAFVTKLAKAFGVRRLIALDLAAIGKAGGPVTEAVCRQIKADYPDAELWTGGGVRCWDDVRRLEDAGVDAVLAATALHDETLTFPRPAG